MRKRLVRGRVIGRRSWSSREAERWIGENSKKRLQGSSEIHACECGSGGWPGPHSFFGERVVRRALALGSRFSAFSSRLSALGKSKQIPLRLSLDIRLFFAILRFTGGLRGWDCNHISQENEFGIGFPKYTTAIHKGDASTIAFAFDSPSQHQHNQLRNLSGDD